MDNTNYTTETRKSQHLNNEERHEIEVHLKDGWSIYRIAKSLGRAYNTVKNEIKRGKLPASKKKPSRYSADEGERVYRRNRLNSRKKYRSMETADFLRYVIEHFTNDDKWSLDACFGRALKEKEFSREEMVCTQTLYNYVDIGLLPIKNIDLPEKLRRNTKAKRARKNKKELGRSIEERPESVKLREEFGHWEIDTVIGKKNEGEPCVMTLVERKTRMAIWVKADDHSSDSIMKAINEVINQFVEKKNEVFKSITGDNGSEFAEISTLEDGELSVFFTHPYSSFEKGTNECHNRMLRRFIPKGKSISDYSADQISFFADCINGLPRKILGYATPEALFEAQLDRIYAA